MNTDGMIIPEESEGNTRGSELKISLRKKLRFCNNLKAVDE